MERLFKDTEFVGRNVEGEKVIETFFKLRKYKNLTFDKKYDIYKLLIKNCKACKAGKETEFPHLSGEIRKNAKYLFVNYSPSLSDVKSGGILLPSTEEGQIFENYLKDLGVNREEISLINICNCCGINNRFLSEEEEHTCSQFKELEFSLINENCNYIFLMGEKVVKWFFNARGNINDFIGNILTIKHNNKDYKFIPIYHPYYIKFNPENNNTMTELFSQLRGSSNNEKSEERV